MNSENPYDSPANPIEHAGPQFLGWSMAVVFGSAALGGLIGIGIGVLLGTLAPEYYQSVFSDSNSPNFNPLAIGIGLGLTQGVVFGGIIGLVLVALFYWYRIQLVRSATE